MELNKSYYHDDNCEFMEGLGTIYTEFMGQTATRQIDIVNASYYLSSLSQDFYEKDFRLYDGEKDELDLSLAKEILASEFDQVWYGLIDEVEINSRLIYREGDATESLKPFTIIMHIVNDLGKWGKGFVLPLGKKYPSSRDSYLTWSTKDTFKLGSVDFCLVDEANQIYVANMLAQQGIKKSKTDNTCYVDYQALEECLKKVADFALVHHLTVQCPKVGTGLAGGDWNIIEELIKKQLCAKKIKCTVFSLVN